MHLLFATQAKLSGNILSNVSVHCDFYQPSLDGCPEVVPLCHLRDHVDTCSFHPDAATKHKPIRAVRPSSTVAEVLTASPSKLKGNVAANLTSRLVTARAEQGRLEVKTSDQGRGHAQVYQLTSTSLVPSTEASISTLKRRESELTRIAESVCGGSAGARVQLVAGLKRLSANEQEALLSKRLV